MAVPRPRGWQNRSPFSVLRTLDGHVAPLYTEEEVDPRELDPRNVRQFSGDD